MAEKKVFTEKQLEKAQKLASEGATRGDIARMLQVNRAVVDRLLRDKIIILAESRRNNQGRTFDWTPDRIARLKEMYASNRYDLQEILKEFQVSETAISRKARSLGLVKNRKAFWQPEDDQFLKDNIEKVSSVKELAEKIGRSNESVYRRLLYLGIADKRPIKMRASEIRDELFQNPDFMKQFEDPTYSHERIGRIWGISGCTVNKWRRQKFGSWQGLTDSFRGKSTAEMDFEDILRELDLAYIYEYKIGKWKNDYYLGHHIVVEVQGEYWHSSQKVKDKDRRKKADLESKGYKMIYVREEHLHTKLGRVYIKSLILKAIRENFK